MGWCVQGYQPAPTLLQCQDDGTLAPATFSCVDKGLSTEQPTEGRIQNCTAPAGLAHTASTSCLEGGQVVSGFTCTPWCESHFRSNVSLACFNGTLTPPDFTCRPAITLEGSVIVRVADASEPQVRAAVEAALAEVLQVEVRFLTLFFVKKDIAPNLPARRLLAADRWLIRYHVDALPEHVAAIERRAGVIVNATTHGELTFRRHLSKVGVSQATSASTFSIPRFSLLEPVAGTAGSTSTTSVQPPSGGKMPSRITSVLGSFLLVLLCCCFACISGAHVIGSGKRHGRFDEGYATIDRGESGDPPFASCICCGNMVCKID